MTPSAEKATSVETAMIFPMERELLTSYRLKSVCHRRKTLPPAIVSQYLARLFSFHALSAAR